MSGIVSPESFDIMSRPLFSNNVIAPPPTPDPMSSHRVHFDNLPEDFYNRVINAVEDFLNPSTAPDFNSFFTEERVLDGDQVQISAQIYPS